MVFMRVSLNTSWKTSVSAEGRMPPRGSSESPLTPMLSEGSAPVPEAPRYSGLSLAA